VRLFGVQEAGSSESRKTFWGAEEEWRIKEVAKFQVKSEKFTEH